MNFILTLFREIWLVTVAMAPYLLFGFLMAGILSELISKNFVRRHLGGRNWVQSLKAALVGVPMPICSCGVIPLAASLREQGASRGATASFLASTPQTGVDSLMVTYALLGLPFARCLSMDSYPYRRISPSRWFSASFFPESLAP